MNCDQVNFKNDMDSFYIEHVADEYEVSNIKPVGLSSEDVKRMAENSYRARLISQIVGAPDSYRTTDFSSSFQCATRDTDPPQFATSHKVSSARSEPKRKPTIPTFPSIGQSLRWNPYVEMSSAKNSHTNILDEKPKFNCRCANCAIKSCPSRVMCLNTTKTPEFKNNIMTFNDRFTMTPKLNDACCGVCTPIQSIPKTSDVCVPSVLVRDTETITQSSMHYQQSAPIPILKKVEYAQCYGHCGHATGHVPVEIRQEAVRDTDVGEDYCEPIKPRSLKSFFKFKRKPESEVPLCMPDYKRKIIYNEGISDELPDICCKRPVRVPSPVNIRMDYSGAFSKFKSKCNIDNIDAIPYSHRSESKYHHSCKKSNTNAVYDPTDVDSVKHMVESPHLVRKSITGKPIKHYRCPSILLPKKMLTSEADIESFILKSSQRLAADVYARRKKNKKYM